MTCSHFPVDGDRLRASLGYLPQAINVVDSSVAHPHDLPNLAGDNCTRDVKEVDGAIHFTVSPELSRTDVATTPRILSMCRYRCNYQCSLKHRSRARVTSLSLRRERDHPPPFAWTVVAPPDRRDSPHRRVGAGEQGIPGSGGGTERAACALVGQGRRVAPSRPNRRRTPTGRHGGRWAAGTASSHGGGFLFDYSVLVPSMLHRGTLSGERLPSRSGRAA